LGATLDETSNSCEEGGPSYPKHLSINRAWLFKLFDSCRHTAKVRCHFIVATSLNLSLDYLEILKINRRPNQVQQGILKLSY
jgi:hypothetical protein